MSAHPFVAFNVLTVPEAMRDTLEERFAKRAGEVETMEGFRHFELLRPVSGTDRYLVYTRWDTKAHFDAWVASMAFGRGHQSGGQDGEQSGARSEEQDGAQAADADGAAERPAPAATGSEVWTFQAIQIADVAPEPQG